MPTRTGIPEIDALIKGINKQFGREIFTDEAYEKVKAFPTGCMSLDLALRIGGFPIGRIVELYGDPSSGKTSLALVAVSSFLRKQKETALEDKRVLIIDLEHSITENFMHGFGIDTDKTIHVRPKTAEEALEIAATIPLSGHIGIVLFDSIGAAQTAATMNKHIGDVSVGGVSKVMHDALRRISKTSEDTETTYIFINHLLSNPGVMYGSPKTTPGGMAVPFFASLRIELMPRLVSKVPETFNLRLKITKTKLAEPPLTNDPIEIPFRYGVGPDTYMDILTTLKTLGKARSAGPVYKVILPDGEEESFQGGIEGVKARMIADENLFNRLKAMCYG